MTRTLPIVSAALITFAAVSALFAATTLRAPGSDAGVTGACLDEPPEHDFHRQNPSPNPPTTGTIR